MRTRRWWWPPGEPRFPLTIAGHGRVHHHFLREPGRLIALAGALPAEWGVLFVLDARRRRWTLYSPDPEYTRMFAPTAHQLHVTRGVFADKFPGWNRGWKLR